MRPIRISRLASLGCALAAPLTVGCKDVGADHCDGVGREVALDEALPDGWTLREALGYLGEQQVTAVWADGTPTELTLAVTRDHGPAEWVEYHRARRLAPFFVAELDYALVCPPPALEIPVRLALATDDGRVDIDEPTVAVTIHASTDLTGELAPAIRVDLDERAKRLDGMPDPEAWTDPRFHPDQARVRTILAETGAAGWLGWSGETHHRAWATKAPSNEVALRWDTRPP